MADVAVTSTALRLSLPVRTGWRRLAVAVLVALVALVLTATAVFQRHADEQARDEARSSQLHRYAEDLLLTLSEARSSQLHYRLTGDERFRAAFDTAALAVERNYRGLSDAAENLPTEQGRVLAIGDIVGREMGALSRAVASASGGQPIAAEDREATESPDLVSTALHSDVQAILAMDELQHTERVAWQHRGQMLLICMLAAAWIGTVVLFAAALRRSRKALKLADQEQHKLASHASALEQGLRRRATEFDAAGFEADRERQRLEALLRDANHRIGNSLATVSSLLGLQVLRARSDEVKEALEAAQARVHAIASGHRRLRLGGDLETVRADEFLGAVSDDLRIMQVSTVPIALHNAFPPLMLRARDATTIGIILGELVTNAFKHAFAGTNGGNVWIRFGLQDDIPVLTVEDDGRGMASGEVMPDEGLGSVIVRQLVQPFGGKPEYRPRDGGGTTVVIPMPGLTVTPTTEAA